MDTDIFQVSHKKGSVETRMASFHHHGCYEVFYFLGNEMSYFIESKTYRLKRYDMVFIDKYTYHKSKYTPDKSRERIVVMFDEFVLDNIGDTGLQQKIRQLFVNRKVSFSKEQNDMILDIFQNRLLPAYSTADSQAGRLKAQLILLEILLTLVDWLEKGVVTAGDQALTTAREKHIYDIINYINNNFSSDITLDSLSLQFFISKYYLCHTFKNVTGTSVMDYINKKRLIEAERLLKNSDLSITEISSRIGYNNTSYFISLFNKKYGYTPNSIKKSYRV